MRLTPLVLTLLLAGCGMKGDLYEAPPAPVSPPVEPGPEATDERKTIPAPPPPARSQ